MKKRILALALAGTTAFSVFGGLTAFASHGADETFTEYNPFEEVVFSTTTGSSGLYVTQDGANVWSDKFTVEPTMDFDEVMETEVKTGVLYAYDFYDYFMNEYDTTAEKLEAALEEDDWENAVAKAMTNDKVVGWTVESLVESGNGKRNTIRRAVTDAWEDFMSGISVELADYSYLYNVDGIDQGADKNFVDDDAYNFVGLIDAIKALDTKAQADFAGIVTSEMVYLMQEFDRLVDGEYVSMKEVDNSAYEELVIEALGARADEDFKKTSQYYTWLEDYETKLAKYEAATTASKHASTFAALEALLINADAAGALKADLTDLTAAAKNTVLGYDLYPVEDYTVASTGLPTDEYAWYQTVLTLAGKVDKYDTQSSIDVITAALEDAEAALEVTTTPKASRMLSLEEWVETYGGLIQDDYKAPAWKNYSAAMTYAEDLLAGDPGKRQVMNAVELLNAYAPAMDLCINHATVKSTAVKELRASIKEAKAWLAKYDDTAAVSKVLAVTKALAYAEKILDEHDDPIANKKCALRSEVAAAVEGVDAALASPAVANGWLKTEEGWMYGTETGYTTGWAKIGAVYYYFDAEGIANESEWMYENGKWYYFTEGCNAVANHWALVDGKWYWFNEDYSMFANGWKWINNKCYYFYASGAMAANTTIDGYVVGADGAWIA